MTTWMSPAAIALSEWRGLTPAEQEAELLKPECVETALKMARAGDCDLSADVIDAALRVAAKLMVAGSGATYGTYGQDDLENDLDWLFERIYDEVAALRKKGLKREQQRKRRLERRPA